MVAFTEFKQVTPKQKLNEASKMSAGNWKATGETTPVKYVNATAKSINDKRTFEYKSGKEIKYGIVSKIIVDGNEMSTKDWLSYALDNYPAWCKSTEFQIDGENVKVTDLYKSEAVKGSLVPNKGDIAEAVLGSAITAKFAQGGRDIKEADVVRILKGVVAQGNVEGLTDYQKIDIQDDAYKFTLTLNSASMKPLKLWIDEDDPMGSPKDFVLVTKFEVSPATIKDLQTQIKHAVEYANNNKRATTAVTKASSDPEKNTVEIISDGGDATQQSSTKVDLKLKYDGQTTRLLSLKAGSVKQFGQISGAEWETVSDFFESIFDFRLPDNFKQKFGFKGRESEDYKEYNYSQGPFQKLYDEMAKQVAVYVKGDNTQQEYKLVQKVYDAINFHATRGEEGVTMVILSPSAKIAYKELAFDARLLSALELYDLQVVNETGSANHRIQILGNLKTEEAVQTIGKDGVQKIPTKNILVTLRTALSGGAIRNIVEMGPLLKDIANIEKLDKAEAEKNQQAQQDNTQPAATAQQEPKQTNDPNAKVEENLMTPKPEFGPTFDIVDDLHIYMRNDPDAYRKQYFPMLCNMQKALENKEKISVKKMMLPAIKQCGADYNKKFGLARSIDELMTMEQKRELAKKIYDEEAPLMRKGAYK